jgi:prepilin-type N-terminal cleavage/methylation domain-containing protein
MNKKTLPNPNGFSLIEVLIAIAILAIGAMSLVQLMALGIKLNIQTTDDTQATTLAQWKMETFNGMGYLNLPLGGDLDSDVTIAGVDYFEDFFEPGSKVVYHKRWKISPCAHTDATIPCAVNEEYYQTPWYEVSVKVTTNRLDAVANTQPRQITLKSIMLQPF